MMKVYTKDVWARAILVGALGMLSVTAGAATGGDPPRPSPPAEADTAQPAFVADLPLVPFLDDSGTIAAAVADAERQESGVGYRWDGPPRAAPDWTGVGRDTLYFIGYQFAAIGVLYIAPEDVSGWSEEDKEDYSFEKWKDNVGNPVWDEDKWWINYILHPYWGGAFYIRAQERGFDQVQSFLYSALLSTLYEFGAEAMFEPPSYQDLIVTPVVGALVGQFLFAPIREHIRAQPGEPGWTGKAVLFLTDPMGVVNVATDRLFGVKADLTLRLTALPVSSDLPGGRRETADGLHDSVSASNDIPAWGLQLRATW